MIKTAVLTVTFFSTLGLAKPFKTKDVSWLKDVQEAGLNQISVCGTDKINLSKKSLNRDFLFGDKGYLMSGLIDENVYWELLKDLPLEQAKEKLVQELKQTKLWVLSKAEGLKSLGEPTKIEMKFKVSIKDCINTGLNHYGQDCSMHQGTRKFHCCREKFPGFKLYWGAQQEYRLGYSPDPSIRLKVAGEAKNRYCHTKSVNVVVD